MASVTFCLLLLLQTAIVLGQRLSKNDDCVVEQKQSKCTLVHECPTAAEAIKQRRPPPICGFEGNVPIVCCPIRAQTTKFTPSPSPSTTNFQPPVTTVKTTQRPQVTTECGVVKYTIDPNLAPAYRVARRKCFDYAKEVFYQQDVSLLPGSKPECVDSCPSEQPLIVGGQNAKLKQFPHMALIGYGATNPEWLCGGTLISEKFVMSAGHCTSPPGRYGLARWVKLGELDLADDFDGAKPIDIRISNRFNHPNYSKTGNFYNDIALYELETRISKFSIVMRPACLKSVGDMARTDAFAAGWGRTAYGGQTSDHLKYVKLNLVSTQRCNSSFAGSIGKAIPQGILSETQICAGDEPGKDTCQGDSGGPLMYPITTPYCMYDVIGVTSFGRSCGMSTPGVYTRVQAYIPWIVSVVWPDELRNEVRNF